MPTTSTTALDTWTALNDRQQGTLACIYALDQAVEAARRRRATAGEWDSTPASQWRRIDFAHVPSDRKLFGVTELQTRLAAYGWDNQGNGSTMAALGDRKLITRGIRPATLGIMHTVALTAAGRAAARAGTTLDAGGKPKAGLSRRSWEVLVTLWIADLRGRPLDWVFSKTIEFVLIGKHIPPLAQQIPGGYEITDRGRDFYRQQHAVHCAAYPDVRAPHPDGAAAEPWPPQADKILARHRRHYRALVAVWRNAHDMQQAADREATSTPPDPDSALPAAVVDQVAALHQLWRDTAQQRAQAAAEHTTDLQHRAARAAHVYAAAALTAFHAAVTRANPLTGLQPPDEDDAWDEPRLAPPAETGIHAIDDQVKKLHGAAVGAPVRRRGPAPKHRAQQPAQPPAPGTQLAALADYLSDHTRDGALLRRLHQEAASR